MSCKIKSLFVIILAFSSSILFSTSEVKAAEYILLTGNANHQLAMNIAKELALPLGKAEVATFNDKEIKVNLLETVRNKHVFIIQPTCTQNGRSVNDNLMELYLLIRTCKRSSAKSVTAVIPYYGYARQDRKMTSRVPISASDVAILLETAGTERVITVDLHSEQIQGFFQRIPVDNLNASRVFIPTILKKKLNNLVIVSPDAGGVSRAKNFRDILDQNSLPASLALIIKQRKKAGQIENMDLVGDVKGKDVIIIDDLVDTAGTLVKAAKLLKDMGAKRILACVTHPVFSKQAFQTIENSDFEEVIVTDSIPLAKNNPKKIKQVSIAKLIANVIEFKKADFY